MKTRTLLSLSLVLTLAVGLFAPTVLADDPIPEGALVVDFEDGTLQGVIGRSNEVLEVTQEQVHGGQYALKCTGRDQNWNAPVVPIGSYVEEGKEYVFSAWIYILKGRNVNTILSAQIGSEVPDYKNLSKVPVREGVWTQLTATYRYDTIPDGYATVYVEHDDPNAEYIIDDVVVHEKVDKVVEPNPDLTLPSLYEIYKDNFQIGNIFTQPSLEGIRFDVLKHHYNVLTPENAMKPENLQPKPGEFRFDAVDALVDKVLAAGIAVHGHVLVWHSQSPSFLTNNDDGTPLTRAQAIENLETHVKTVAGHYAGKLQSWDVVNEAIADNATGATWQEALRVNIQGGSHWVDAFANGADASKGESGADFIEYAFRAAREADPSATLYYNDYGLDNQKKASYVAWMVNEINEKYKSEGNERLLIEGVGMQGHYGVYTSPDDVASSIRMFSQLGVEISISELDVEVTSSNKELLPRRQQEEQADTYSLLFQTFLEYQDRIKRVTFWGMDDKSSWKSDKFPVLLNADLTAKAAFYAVADPVNYYDYLETPTPAPTPEPTEEITPEPTADLPTPAPTEAPSAGRSNWPLFIGLGIAVPSAAVLVTLFVRGKNGK